MSNKINIGLFGFGCVGFGLYEVLAKTPSLQASIQKIVVRQKDKLRPIDSRHFHYEKEDILNDDTINTVVELVDDADAAYDIVTTALKKGKAVVTANKKMIAEHLPELLALQKQYGVPLLYEAACCASIPIIRNLEEYYDNDLLVSLHGIVNGSTNYILTQTDVAQMSFADALADAQERGYAESNPSLDIQGYDAKYKLLILLAHAFGIVVQPDELFNIGIDQLSDIDLNYAREKGYKVKLVAYAHKDNNGAITAFVMPQFIEKTHHLSGVDDVYNGICIQSSFSDIQFFQGKGAGAHPTASAVLSDISALSYDYKYGYKKINDIDYLKSEDDIYLKVMISHHISDSEIIKSHFSQIEESYFNHTQGYWIGIISLASIRTLTKLHDLQCSIILFRIAASEDDGDTHEYQEVASIELV